MPAGQPPKYRSAEVFDKKCQEYFNRCEELDLLPTLPGLAIHLGFADKQSLYDQKKRNSRFSYSVKRAVARIEEKHIRQGRAMDIFVMKNNFNYVDKVETENSGDININVTYENVKTD